MGKTRRCITPQRPRYLSTNKRKQNSPLLSQGVRTIESVGKIAVGDAQKTPQGTFVFRNTSAMMIIGKRGENNREEQRKQYRESHLMFL